jgi:hypothetical protein
MLHGFHPDHPLFKPVWMVLAPDREKGCLFSTEGAIAPFDTPGDLKVAEGG